MSPIPRCTIVVDVAGDFDFPTSPSLPSIFPSSFSGIPLSDLDSEDLELLTPPGGPLHRVFAYEASPPYFRPAWIVAPGEDPDADRITLVPNDSEFEVAFDPGFDDIGRPRKKTGKKGKRRLHLRSRVSFFGTVVVVVAIQGLMSIGKLIC